MNCNIYFGLQLQNKYKNIKFLSLSSCVNMNPTLIKGSYFDYDDAVDGFNKDGKSNNFYNSEIGNFMIAG